jgi:hypothetical protein
VVVWVGLFAGKAGSPKQSQESKTIVLDS